MDPQLLKSDSFTDPKKRFTAHAVLSITWTWLPVPSANSDIQKIFSELLPLHIWWSMTARLKNIKGLTV